MTFLRGRPWLVPSLLAFFLGVMQLITASDDSNPTSKVVFGLIFIVLGGLMVVSAEYEHRKRQKAARRPAENAGTPRIPPAAG